MGRVLQVEQLTKVYHEDRPEIAVRAVDGVSFVVEHGESLAIIGPSGCGKSTLLQLLGCLDQPSAGRYMLDGQNVAGLPDDALAQVRNAKIGFVFQSFQLLPRLTVAENVQLPLLYAQQREPAKRREERALQVLERVGLAQRAHHLPAELSGGQRQRVAVARALITRPAMLLCDEPTGALDSRTSAEVLGLLADLHRDGVTLVMVTHDLAVARAMTRAMWMRDGRIERDGACADVVDAFLQAQQRDEP